MDPNDYLNKILASQTFREDDPELENVRKRRQGIEEMLRGHFSGSKPSVRWGGSIAKGTMIREAYDGDMTCYFPHDEKEAGESLEEIYNNVAEALGERFAVERKTSALRVKDPSRKEAKGFPEDLHIDVVPGRFVDAAEADVFLHRTTGDKERLKTNLDVHIEHIRDSGVRPAIRLMKLWNVRNCVFRPNPATDSDASRPPVPTERGH
jgi:tRNA nucleotidyltransferase (CCA-adding enzyme)